MRVILVGFAASYKTSAGKILAQKLGLEFWDTDLQVEALGESIASIFQTRGEQAFRILESNVLESLQNAHGVISCGGGAVLSDAFSRFVAGSVVVWLKSSAQTVYARLQIGTRPLFDGMSVTELQIQMEKRNSFYERYATFSVVTDGKTPEQVAEEMVQKLTACNYK